MTFCLPSTCTNSVSMLFMFSHHHSPIAVAIAISQRLLRHHPPSPPSRIPSFPGLTYVGVQQTQDELEVRLLAGDERHLCGIDVRCRGSIGGRLSKITSLGRAWLLCVQVRILRRQGWRCVRDRNGGRSRAREQRRQVKRATSWTSHLDFTPSRSYHIPSSLIYFEKRSSLIRTLGAAPCVTERVLTVR